MTHTYLRLLTSFCHHYQATWWNFLQGLISLELFCCLFLLEFPRYLENMKAYKEVANRPSNRAVCPQAASPTVNRLENVWGNQVEKRLRSRVLNRQRKRVVSPLSAGVKFLFLRLLHEEYCHYTRCSGHNMELNCFPPQEIIILPTVPTITHA